MWTFQYTCSGCLPAWVAGAPAAISWYSLLPGHLPSPCSSSRSLSVPTLLPPCLTFPLSLFLHYSLISPSYLAVLAAKVLYVSEFILNQSCPSKQRRLMILLSLNRTQWYWVNFIHVHTVVVSVLGSQLTANHSHDHFPGPNHQQHRHHCLHCRILPEP